MRRSHQTISARGRVMRPHLFVGDYMVLSKCGQCGVLKHEKEMQIVTHRIGEELFLDVKCTDCVMRRKGIYAHGMEGKPICPTCGKEINGANDYTVCESKYGYWDVACNACFLRREDLRPAGMKYDLQDRDYYFGF